MLLFLEGFIHLFRPLPFVLFLSHCCTPAFSAAQVRTLWASVIGRAHAQPATPGASLKPADRHVHPSMPCPQLPAASHLTAARLLIVAALRGGSTRPLEPHQPAHARVILDPAIAEEASCSSQGKHTMTQHSQ